ncbi:hypothetical protein J4Q44_G00352840 [Coregonus suidteri]|uniref:Uncharacterized protein n=1 Tax=Coregonus suidteri TaxID=861788 RepID=A0AAN8Q7N4_9TELE
METEFCPAQGPQIRLGFGLLPPLITEHIQTRGSQALATSSVIEGVARVSKEADSAVHTSAVSESQSTEPGVGHTPSLPPTLEPERGDCPPSSKYPDF